MGEISSGLLALAGAPMLPALGDGLPGRLWSPCRFGAVYLDACLYPDNGCLAEPLGGLLREFFLKGPHLAHPVEMAWRIHTV